MKIENIRQHIRRLYDAAGEMAFTAELIQKDYGVYIPGSSSVPSETSYPVRLIKMKTTSGKSGIEDGPVLEKDIQMGLLECEGAAPQVDDELDLDEERQIIAKVNSVDMGAGLLYEVWYS